MNMVNSKEVALFTTCIIDQVMPEVGIATVKLLKRIGCQVSFPEEQTCCGQPFSNSGFRKESIRLIKHTIETFEPYPTVVMPNGSCAAMVRKEYVHMLEGQPEWQERAEKLVQKTFELSEFLVKIARWQPPVSTHAPSVTFHGSCHTQRMLGVIDEPRQLLKAAGCEIVEMSEPGRCCGFGGLFSVRMPEISNAMTEEKLRQAKDTGAEMLVTIDPGCLMQMRGMLGNSSFRLEHFATIMEEVTR